MSFQVELPGFCVSNLVVMLRIEIQLTNKFAHVIILPSSDQIFGGRGVRMVHGAVVKICCVHHMIAMLRIGI